MTSETGDNGKKSLCAKNEKTPFVWNQGSILSKIASLDWYHCKLHTCNSRLYSVLNCLSALLRKDLIDINFLCLCQSMMVSGVLLVFHLLDLIVSITIAAFACSATCNCSTEVSQMIPPPLHLHLVQEMWMQLRELRCISFCVCLVAAVSRHFTWKRFSDCAAAPLTGQLPCLLGMSKCGCVWM